MKKMIYRKIIGVVVDVVVLSFKSQQAILLC